MKLLKISKMNKELLVKLVFHARCPTSGFEQQGLRVLVRFGDVDSLSQAHIDIPFKIYNKKLVVIIHNSILSSTCRQYSMNFVQWFEKSYFLCQKKKIVFFPNTNVPPMLRIPFFFSQVDSPWNSNRFLL